jgi:hypothetical protein
MTRRTRLHIDQLDDRCLPSFSPGVTAGLGAYPVAADFNNDGRADVAAVYWDETDTTIRVALGNGDGTFQPARISATGLGPWWDPLGSYPQSLAVGDFNADGNLDLVVATYDEYDYWTYEGYGDGGFLILLGNGDGTFTAGAPVYTGSPSNYVATGDLNADGHSDLVVTSDDPYGMGGQSVSVWLGRGDGTVAWAAGYAVEDSFPSGDGLIDIYAPVLADFNGDGAVDVADFNGDGRPDVAVANAGSNTVSVLLNDGAWDGSPPPPPATPLRIGDVTVTEGNTGTAPPPSPSPCPPPAPRRSPSPTPPPTAPPPPAATTRPRAAR